MPTSSAQMISVRWWNANAYYAVSLAKVLHEAGHSALVAGRAGSPPLEKAAAWHLDTLDTLDFESNNPITLSKSITRLKSAIKQRSIQIISAHRPQDVLFGYLARKQLRDKPILIRSVSDVRAPKNNAINRHLHISAIDYIIFSCHAIRNRYLKIWPHLAQKSSVVYSAVDTDHFFSEYQSDMREALQIPEESCVFGLIARLSPVKDHVTFLEAAALAHKECPESIFIISGEDFEISMDELIERARELEIDKSLRFLGKANDVRDIIQTLDVGVICSTGSEVICRIAAEYMAMGKPVISSRINILPEMIIDGENGATFPAASAKALAARLIDFAKDRSLCKQLGKNARVHAEQKFSYETFARETLHIYRHLLKQKQMEA
ncbi:MAG: glycosyltransferase family 4 protein [Calditrichia bacterium]